MTSRKMFLRASLAASLALALVACDSNAEAEVTLDGEPIAAIPAPGGADWNMIAVMTEDGGGLVGNPDAPIKIIEYASHTCGACANFSQTGSEPIKAYVASGVVSYELRNLIRDPLDLTIARLVRCGSPEAFHPLADQAWGAFDQIMTTAQQNGAAIQSAATAQNFQAVAQAAGLLDFFAARGISNAQANACLADTDGVMAIAEQSEANANADDVNSTPTFFINGKMLEERQWPQLEAVLQRAGARAE